MAFAALTLNMLRWAGDPIEDPDTLWHVLAGQRLSETWRFVESDPFSHFSSKPWIYNQWLPELAFATANHLGGLPAVVWLVHLGRVALFVAIFLTCRQTAAPLPAVLAASLALVGASGSLGPRPQLVGLILFTVTVAAWIRAERKGRVSLWLIPLSWVWACSHGTWTIGVAIGCVAIVGLALDHRLPRHELVKAVVVVTVSGLAGLATPVGPRLLASMKSVGSVSPFIQEWQPGSVNDPAVAVTLGMAITLFVLWAKTGSLPSWTTIGLTIAAIGMTLIYLRTVALGALLLSPLVAAELQRLTRLTAPRVTVKSWLPYGVVAALGAVLGLVVAPTESQSLGGVPTRLSVDLSALHPGTVIYNTDGLGGWLLWSFPNVTGTSDTRAEVFGASEVRAYQRTMAALPGWEQDPRLVASSYALIGEDTALSSALEKQRWEVLGSDAGYVLLRHPQ